MKKKNSHFISFFKRVTGGATHVALMQWALIALFVLLPVLIIPTFGDIYGPIKQAALVVLTTLAFLGWTLGVYREQAWKRRKGLVIWTPVLVLVGVIVSAMMSSSGYTAWIGAGGQGFTAVVPFFAMVLLYIMVMHVSNDKKALRQLTFAALVGVGLALIYGVIEFFGFTPLSGDMGFSGFSLIGTFESMGMLGAIMTLLVTGIWVVGDRSKADTWMPTRSWTIAFAVVGGIVAITTIFFLILGDRWATEIVLLVGSGLMVALGLHDPKKFTTPKRMLLPMGIFSTALLLLMFNPAIQSSIPVEIAPSFESSWSIGVSTLEQDGLFGSGPGTWMYDFTRFKPDDFNQGQFWQSNFDHASSHMLTLFSTWGIITTSILILFCAWIIVRAVDALMLKRAREEWQTTAVLFSVWLAFLASRFLYSSDIVLDTFFWLFTGMFVAHIVPKTRSHSFQSHGRASLLTSVAIVFAGIVFIMSSVVSMQWLSGEAIIAKAVEAQQKANSADDVVNLVGRAVKLNSWNSGYTRSLAVAHFQRVNHLADNADKNVDAIVQGSEFAVTMAKRAIELEPLDVRGYHILGTIYENLSTVIGGSEVLALDQFRTAVILDPKNPIRHVRLAQAILLVSDNAKVRIEDEELRKSAVAVLLEEAESVIDVATRLKPNYGPAFYTRSLILDRQGKIDEAVRQMLPLIDVSPRDPVLRFELGVLLLRAGDKSAALQSFQMATRLAPTYANAKWYMVALYEEAGELDKAIRELEDLNILNPDDVIVKDKLNLLQQGLSSQQAADELAPLEDVAPPVQ